MAGQGGDRRVGLSAASLGQTDGLSRNATATDSPFALTRPDRPVTIAPRDTRSRYRGRRAPSPEWTPAAGEASPTLTVQMLGSLRVTLNDVSVSEWTSGRGCSVFKYLLTNRNPWPSREMLMEEFWPNAAPQSARNCLNVAVCGLRRALRAAADVPIVVLEGGTYRLHPDVRLWLDVEEFERSVGRWRELEQSGEPTLAAGECELAASLYQGDFLADDPYEDWAALTRERLRLAYLDTLGRLSQLYLCHTQYASCAMLCQRIIERDPCREDAHRRLMRCYSRQGQPHLALRLYWACVEALRDELEVEVSPATVELRERIRRHEPV